MRAVSSGYARILLSSILCLTFFFPSLGHSATEEVKKAVRELLHEEPELILNILKDNSEAVLEIAQQGNLLRKRKMLFAQWKEDAKVPKNINLKGRFFRGSASAPVTIVAFSDFTCGYCRQSEVILNQILSKYNGIVRIVFKPLPKEEVPLSLAAAKYSTAAFLQDEAKGWDLYYILFAGIDEMERTGDNFIKTAATKIGLNLKKLKLDAAGSKVEMLLNEDRKEADLLEITGTPYFLVNDLVIRGSVSKDIFDEAISMALELKGIKTKK